MTHPRWQFSIRTLLALTAFLSIALAFVMKLPMLSAVLLMVAVPVLLLVAVLHIANYVTSDARPVLSILAWFLLAGFFAIYTIGALLVPLPAKI